MCEQAGKARIVAQGRVEAAEGDLLPGAIDGPGRVGLGADCVPDSAVKIVRKRLTSGGAQYQAQDLRLGAGVVPFGSRRSGARIELCDAGRRILSGLTKQVARELRHIVVPIVNFRERYAGRHVSRQALKVGYLADSAREFERGRQRRRPFG